MIQWLLFDRVDAKAAGPTIAGQDDFFVLTGANETEAPLPFMKLAETRTQVALNSTIITTVPVFRRNDMA